MKNNLNLKDSIHLEKSDIELVIEDEDEVMSFIENASTEKNRFTYNDLKHININSTFRKVCENPSCASCQRDVDKVVLMQNGNLLTPFLFSEDGILLTKDHIVPKSLNGSNHSANIQTMCVVCNKEKGNFFDGKVKKVLTAKFVKVLLHEKNQHDNIDIVSDKIRERKQNNHLHPTLFLKHEIVDFFDGLDENDIIKFVDRMDGVHFHLLPEM